jgi:hypothetical protein
MSADPSPEEIARFHRWNAVECNNRAWSLGEQRSRTPAEDEEMLHAAHAAAFHWAKAGTDLHQARAWMLLGQVHAALGHGQAAWAYARRSYEYFRARESPDWEIAFAHAVLAHAAYADEDPGLHRRHHARAAELGRAIADPEDRAVFFRTFDLIPCP